MRSIILPDDQRDTRDGMEWPHLQRAWAFPRGQLMDFSEILSDHRIDYRTSGPKTRKGWLQFQCPFCQKTPYMGYNVNAGYCNCWNCGYHPVWEVIAVITGVMPASAVELANQLPRNRVFEQRKPRGKLIVPPGVTRCTIHHEEYIHERGFNVQKMRKLWGVQGIGQVMGILKWRLFLPIMYQGEMVAWTTRKIRPGEPRYVSSKPDESAIPPAELLYGVDYCRSSAIVVEGPMDVWAIGPGGCATMGFALTAAKLEQISRFPIRVICFDSESDAQGRARKLASDLSVFEGVTHNITLESGKDAAEADPEEITELRKEFLDAT